MLVTNFKIKYLLYKFMQAAYQLNDVAQMHPVRELQKRALTETVTTLKKICNGQ